MKHLAASRRHLEAPARHLEASGRHLEASRRHLGVIWEACGRLLGGLLGLLGSRGVLEGKCAKTYVFYR